MFDVNISKGGPFNSAASINRYLEAVSFNAHLY